MKTTFLFLLACVRLMAQPTLPGPRNENPVPLDGIEWLIVAGCLLAIFKLAYPRTIRRINRRFNTFALWLESYHKVLVSIALTAIVVLIFLLQ